jgi:hypothetical protein
MFFPHGTVEIVAPMAHAGTPAQEVYTILINTPGYLRQVINQANDQRHTGMNLVYLYHPSLHCPVKIAPDDDPESLRMRLMFHQAKDPRIRLD